MESDTESDFSEEEEYSDYEELISDDDESDGEVRRECWSAFFFILLLTFISCSLFVNL